MIELEQRCEEACVARVSPLACGRRHLMVTKSFLPRILIISSCRAPTNFCRNLLARFGTSEGAIRTYLGCALERDILAGTTTLFQKNYAEDVCAHMALRLPSPRYCSSTTQRPVKRRLRPISIQKTHISFVRIRGTTGVFDRLSFGVIRQTRCAT